jgi:hypothetical protein
MADLFISLLQQRYRDFVQERLQSDQHVTIIESVMLQDTINCAYHMGMNREKLLYFANSLQETLAPLSPMLVYFYHLDVEGQWRFICGVRGNVWDLFRCIPMKTSERPESCGEAVKPL